MTTTHTAFCTTCGAEFKASPTGYTVRCPECRKPKAPAAKAFTTIKVVEHRGMRCTIPGCGRPAVTAFTGPTGETFAECAAHAPARYR